MILSVSRRTDIPAFYSEWFFNRLKEGYVYVRNPMAHNQVSKVSLSPLVVDCIVFWTKDPANILDRLDELSSYNYYFLITITGYDSTIERHVRPKESIIGAFKKLSEKIGKERTIWRYDPIIVTDKLDPEFHFRKFDFLASQLEGSTDLCIISFLDWYKKTKRNMRTFNVQDMDEKKMMEIGKKLADIAKSYGISMAACSEPIDLSSVGIVRAKCIDDGLISRVIGQPINVEKDRNQRNSCGCVMSVDIGAYNTCQHGCLYCYANYSDKVVQNNISKHDPTSPFLIGGEEPGDRITERKMESYVDGQLSFDVFRQ